MGMTVLFGAIDFALYLLIAVALVRKYSRTRDAGLLWLSLPLVLIPVVALPLACWLSAAADRLALGQPVGFYPFTLVEQGRLTLGDLLTRVNFLEHAVWGLLALAAVLALSRQKAHPTSKE